MNFFTSFFSKPNVEISFNEIKGRRPCYLRNDDAEKIKLPSFYDKEDVSGEIIISLTSKSFDHNGITVSLLGIIEARNEPSNTSQFITLTKEIVPAGNLHNQLNKFKYQFTNVEKSYESYWGAEMNVKYIIRVSIGSTLRTLTWEREFGVINPQPRNILNHLNDSIKINVGIEDWLSLDFEIDKTKYGTKDIVEGRVIFHKVSHKLQAMMIQIIRKEILIGNYEDTALLCRYEIMDGAPVKNEVIPFRLFLSPYDFSPTYPNINNKLSVQYFINFVIIDSEEKRYFKQSEIVLQRIIKQPFIKEEGLSK